MELSSTFARIVGSVLAGPAGFLVGSYAGLLDTDAAALGVGGLLVVVATSVLVRTGAIDVVTR